MEAPAKSNRNLGDYRWVFYALAVVMIVIDQMVKAWARHKFGNNLASMQAAPFPGVFEFTLTYNRGIAFGLFQGSAVFLTPIALLMTAIAGYNSFKLKRGGLGFQIALALLAAGALGNLYDRMFEGQVTDIFYFRLINFPVFNIADACITISAIMLVFMWTIESVKEAKPSPASTPVAGQNPSTSSEG